LRQQVDELNRGAGANAYVALYLPTNPFASESLLGELVNAGNDIARSAIASYQVLRSQKGSQYDITLSVEYRELAEVTPKWWCNVVRPSWQVSYARI
jgi:hypothetical protein